MTAVLSAREAEVWALLSTPMTYAEIGARLFISPRTVESHVNSLRNKLDASDRRELAQLWAERRQDAGMPAELSSFVGREAELAETALALAQARLVSLVGPGGAGKTRLAIRAARGWTDASGGRCVYADLVPLPPGAAVTAFVAAACQAAVTGRVETAIAARLVGGPVLLVLDNAEHVLDSSARVVEELLTQCPELRVLVTSRIRLVLPFERVLTVGGLAPGVDGDAVRLFHERARATAADPRRVEAICAALGGLPLAIELAAARLGALGVDGLEESLTRQLDVLQGGARLSDRHRSLSSTIAWSFHLLKSVERDALAGVSVFAEPFTISAAEAVLAAPVGPSIATLCEHSLLQVEDHESQTYYRALEAVREFGRRQLSDAEASELALRHARWAVDDGSAAEQRSAAEWSTRTAGQAELAHELWHSLAGRCFREGRLRDAQAAYERDADITTAVDRARALVDAAAVARCRVLGEEATRLDLLAVDALLDADEATSAAEALARIADHAVRFVGMFADPLAAADVDSLLDRAHSLAGTDPVANAALAVAHVQQAASRTSDPVRRARATLEGAEAAGAPQWVSGAIDALCVALVESGEIAEAAQLSVERAELIAGAADDPRFALEIKDALHTGAQILAGAGRLPEALDVAQRHLRMPFLRAEPDLASEELFAPAALSGEWGTALEHVEDYLSAWHRASSAFVPGRVMGPLSIALIHRLRDDEDEHARWREVAQRMRGEAAPSAYGAVFDALGRLHIGEVSAAAEILDDRPHGGFYGRLFREWALALRFEAAVLRGEQTPEPHLSANPVARVIVERARALREGDADAVLATREGFSQLGCPYQADRTVRLAMRI